MDNKYAYLITLAGIIATIVGTQGTQTNENEKNNGIDRYFDGDVY